RASPLAPGSPPPPYTPLFRSRAGVEKRRCARSRNRRDGERGNVAPRGARGVDPTVRSKTVFVFDSSRFGPAGSCRALLKRADRRSEEHTSELQSRENLVCRLL